MYISELVKSKRPFYFAYFCEDTIEIDKILSSKMMKIDNEFMLGFLSKTTIVSNQDIMGVYFDEDYDLENIDECKITSKIIEPYGIPYFIAISTNLDAFGEKILSFIKNKCRKNGLKTEYNKTFYYSILNYLKAQHCSSIKHLTIQND